MELRRSLSIVALLFASACSGASSTELFDQVGQDSVPAAPIVGRDDETSSGSSPSSSSSSGGSSSASSSSSSASSSSSSSSGGSGAPQPGPSADAGAPPPPACTVEAEPNDGPANTNWFTECFSGSVKRDDHDYASISAPTTAKRIEIEHAESGGDVQYRIYLNGVAFKSFTADAPDFIPVFGGATYSFEMSPSGGNANRTYELHVTFE